MANLGTKAWPRDWAPKPNISYSSYKTFDECPWRYILSAAPKEVKDFLPAQQQLEIRLGPWPGLAGSVVDETIRLAISHYMGHREWQPDEYIGKTAADLLRFYWQASVKWKEDRAAGRREVFGEASSIDRIYYEGNDLPRADRIAVRDQVDRCIGNWLTCGIRSSLELFPVEQWRLTQPVAVQSIPWFWLDGTVPVYSSYDFAVVSPELTLIIDWKCGRETSWSRDAVRRQLHIYADFAFHQWKSDFSTIRLQAVWLDSGDTQEVPFDRNLLNEMRADWTYRHSALASRFRELTREPANVAEIFPKSTSDRVCRRCSIRSCQGWQETQVATTNIPIDDVDPFAED